MLELHLKIGHDRNSIKKQIHSQKKKPTEQSPSVVQMVKKFLGFYGNRKFPKSPLLDLTLNEMNPLCTFIPCFLKIRFNIVFLSPSRCPK
jgi:hypothetical protein